MEKQSEDLELLRDESAAPGLRLIASLQGTTTNHHLEGECDLAGAEAFRCFCEQIVDQRPSSAVLDLTHVSSSIRSGLEA